jgi:EAL domain-containing protein (putative c-di-GMP-specific phosphodiesterase class I)
VSVNVGARQLHYDVLIDHVREDLASSGLDPGHLTPEVTESSLSIDPKITAQHLTALSELGCLSPSTTSGPDTPLVLTSASFPSTS